MRREVKRSLIFYPLTTSLSVVAIIALTCTDGTHPGMLAEYTDHIRQSRYGREWPLAPQTSIPPSGNVVDAGPTLPMPIDIDVAVAERSEHGAPAMTTPERLVERTEPVVPAPIRDEQQETAGLVLGAPIVTPEVIIEIETIDLTPPSSNGQTNVTLASTRPNPVVPEFVGPPMPEPQSVLVKAENEHPTESVAPLEAIATNDRSPSDRHRLLDQAIVSPSDDSWGKRNQTAPTEVVQQLPPSLEIPVRDDETPSPPTTPETEQTQPEFPPPSPTSTPQAPILTPPTDDDVATEISDHPAGWPVTTKLNQQLEELDASVDSEDAMIIAQWVREVRTRLSTLQSLTRVGDPAAGVIINQLSELAVQGLQLAERWPERSQQIDWLCTAYAVQRRTAVWKPVFLVSASEAIDPDEIIDRQRLSFQAIDHAISVVKSDLSSTGDRNRWQDYLLLDRIEDAAKSEDFKSGQVTAQQFLSRLEWHGLDAAQRKWLERESIRALAKQMRIWSQGPVDYASLLAHIERQESDAIDLASIDIASAIQSLRFSDYENAADVAAALNIYYRNANIRTAISQPMLQRFMPTIEPQSVAVRTNVLGSHVRGTSQIHSQLSIQLHPSPNRWAFTLQAKGQVKTQSTGFNGPVAVRTSGNSRFDAATPIMISSDGIEFDPIEVDANGWTKLRGIKSDYDGWPLIGPMVRTIAESRYDSMSHQSNRIANRRIENQVSDEIDAKLEAKIDDASDQLETLILGPLSKLQLDPQVTDMSTTPSRLLARYRLAGDWQLAAFTPRPRAPMSSLMSVQIHQSALNNMLEQLAPRNESKSIQEIVDESMDLFGQENRPIPNDIPDDVTIRFAPTRPVTIEIENGEFWITLRIVQLNRGDRLDLRRFIVRAKYLPHYDGLNATLVRDGHLRISGKGMSMRQRLPIRTIFNKVLSPNRPVLLTLPQLAEHPAAEGLAVSQLELRNGWLAIAISESNSPKIALQPRNEKSLY